MASEVSIAGADLPRRVAELERELRDAHRREGATAEVLKAISRSTFNLQEVLDRLIESAVQLTGAETGLIIRQDGEVYRAAAIYGASPEFVEVAKQNPIPQGRQSATGRAVLGRRIIHIHDVFDDPEYTWVGREAAGVRTILAVPMLREEIVVGVIGCGRREVRPFTAKQIELVQTFADQAVIAIENTRLFEEVQAKTRDLSEALEHQTATAEVLQIINSSPGALGPIFSAILDKATRICQAPCGILWTYDGERLHAASVHVPPAFAEFLREPLPGDAAASLMRIVRGGMGRQVADLLASDDYRAGNPLRRATVDLGGARTVVTVPLRKHDNLFGIFVLYRQEVRLFTDKQIELVKNFAGQAVIAIENTRLFEAEQASKRELRESLEYQTAISEVLGVISRSSFELQPVLDTIVSTATRLCQADMANLRRREGDCFRHAASIGYDTNQRRYIVQDVMAGRRDTIVGRVATELRTIHLPDIQEDPDFSHGFIAATGLRTGLAVPLLHDATLVGTLALWRREPKPYTPEQIALIETFADQAVIAIENTRLFEEVQARTRELAKTVEELEIASQHKSQFVANMSHELRTPLAAILGYAELIQEGFYEPQGPKSLDALTRIRSNGKHLLGLINTVLDIAKIESGQFTLNMAEYVIESVVETVRSATESLAQNKKLALMTEVAKPLPIGLGDEQRLTQVLLNLVGNAIKFTDTGEVRVTARAFDGHFNVSVSDTGPGIPAEHQTRIFERFQQVDNSNTRAKGGTGLGLAIAKQIIEMHGGRIWVESTLGKGSTFQMEIPTRAEFQNSAP